MAAAVQVASPAATASVQMQIAAQQRAAQAVLRAGMVRDVLAAWHALFQPANARASWPALRTLLAALVRDRASMSASLASGYYAQARAAAGVPGGFRVPTVPLPVAEQVDATVDSMGLGSFLRAVKAGQTSEQATTNAGVLLSGATSRLALQSGRETVMDALHADREAIGWVRITDARPCSWCAMLASRGISYKSEKTASFKAHDHCACVAAPAFSGDEVWLQHGQDLRDQWDTVTSHLSGKDALNAWRRHWERRSSTDRTGEMTDGSA